MLSRRNFLLSAAAAGAGSLIAVRNAVLANASQPSTPVNFQVPPHACDCHTHVFGDARRFPFVIPRAYTPEPASVAETRALHRTLGIERIVIVQPSVYGTDNSCTLDGVKQLGSIARGIVVIDDKTPDSVLDEMQGAGIRGIRLNLELMGQTDPAACRHIFQAAVDRIKSRRNWHIQINTQLSVVEGIKDQVMAAPMPIVFDHFAELKIQLGVGQPGFDTLLNLARTGKAYVKLTKLQDDADVTPFAKALIAANPQRMLWGTNWPHPDFVPGGKFTDISPLEQVDDGRGLNLLAQWVPDAAVRKTILVENPANLFGF